MRMIRAARRRHSERFAFGENWLSYVALVDQRRIDAATESLARALPRTALAGRTFLDIGCGSGLFSLAAQRLGARVHSFDRDAGCVAATARLRERWGSAYGWVVEEGSILDRRYAESLGLFDVVYAWGVLHHTGDLWGALDAAAQRVVPGGWLFVSVYNDQGFESRVWTRVKRWYNSGGRVRKRVLVAGSFCYLYRHHPLRGLARLMRPSRRGGPRAERARGMSARHDLIDWVGGYPFEVAKPEQVFARVHRLGFELRGLSTCAGGLGCNEFVFERRSAGQGTSAEHGADRAGEYADVGAAGYEHAQA